MQLFYTPEIDTDDYTLSKDESRHCIQVLRKKIGDTIYLVDGKGGLFTASLIDDNPKSCSLKIESVQRNYGKSNVHIHIAVAPTKMNDRFEWFLEKATEIGIHEITPLICDHSERKVVKSERMNKILVASMKQSQRAYLPKLNEPVAFKTFVHSERNSDCYIAHCEKESNKKHLQSVVQKDRDCLVLIGPEGDFSPQEIDIAMQQGYSAVSLGNSRLRTETAALSSCFIINLINQ